MIAIQILSTGKFVSFYDPDAEGGRGMYLTTNDPAEALQFESKEEAARCVRQQSSVAPYRADGKPNRPLTAFDLEFVTWAED
jgi:hypothetical protein